jgi:hypothetical protein
MKKKQNKRSPKNRNKNDDELEKIAEKAERGEDISEHFTGNHSAKQRVNVDFPLELLKQIDTECRRLGISRQAWIKIACDDKLRTVEERLYIRRAS